MLFTVIRSRGISDPVLVTDGDSRKPYLFGVLNSQVDADRPRQVVRDAVLDLEHGEGCSDDQQQGPDGPSERRRGRTGHVAKSDDRRLVTEPLGPHDPQRLFASWVLHWSAEIISGHHGIVLRILPRFLRYQFLCSLRQFPPNPSTLPSVPVSLITRASSSEYFHVSFGTNFSGGHGTASSSGSFLASFGTNFPGRIFSRILPGFFRH